MVNVTHRGRRPNAAQQTAHAGCSPPAPPKGVGGTRRAPPVRPPGRLVLLAFWTFGVSGNVVVQTARNGPRKRSQHPWRINAGPNDPEPALQTMSQVLEEARGWPGRPPRPHARRAGPGQREAPPPSPRTGSSHSPVCLASINRARSAQREMSKAPGWPKLNRTGRESRNRPNTRSGPSTVCKSRSGMRRPSSGCPSPRS